MFYYLFKLGGAVGGATRAYAHNATELLLGDADHPLFAVVKDQMDQRAGVCYYRDGLAFHLERVPPPGARRAQFIVGLADLLDVTPGAIRDPLKRLGVDC